MARTMALTHTGIYRTVSRTTFLRDSLETTWEYDKFDNYTRKKIPVHKAGDVVVEVFGPYINKSQNQNYTQVRGGYYEDTDELVYDPKDRSKYTWVSDDEWSRSYANRKRQRYVPVVRYDAEYQELKPVFSLNTNGTLSMELDWVKYR